MVGLYSVVDSRFAIEMESLVRERLNAVFDLLELVIVRTTLLILLALGAYSLIRGHL